MINQGTFDRIEDAVDNFEETWSPESRSKIEGLLSEFGLSNDHEAIVELIRVDIELRYDQGLSIELSDYLDRFGLLLDQPDRVAQIAFEDYRSRSANGHSISASRWRGLPGVSRTEWFQELSRDSSKPRGAPRTAKLQIDPTADPAFEAALEESGFHLVQKIGEGAFSRVYLANQYDLADRFVVLKIVNEALAEPERMALLQHTNIVPIYSFHRILSRSVICMPYTGCVTLNDFLCGKSDVASRGGQTLVTTVQARIEETRITSTDQPSRDEGAVSSRSIPAADDSAALHPLEAFESLDCCELANWIFQRLAGALAHAHARGVLHNDLKPSNVLIRNDGEPALLDFNLSQSLNQKMPRHVGGTLPYMSPETYRAMMGIDIQPHAASDLYGLGVMLFEFVTGRLPYPTPQSIAPIDLGPAIEARRATPDWQADDKVDPGLMSIIDRCLQFEATDRYGSAEQLQFDLQCEQKNLALVNTAEPAKWRFRKWTRRHPRAISSGLVATLLLACLIPITYKAVTWQRDYRTLRSLTQYESFAGESADFLSTMMADPNRQKGSNVDQGVALLEQYDLLDPEQVNRVLSARSSEEKVKARATMLRHIVHVGILETSRLSQLQHSDPAASRDFARLDRLTRAAKDVEEGGASRARLFLEAKRAQLSGNEKRHQLLQETAESTPADSDSEIYLEAVRLLAEYDHVGASNLLTALADRNSVPSALRWTMLGRAQYADGKIEDAKLSFTQSIARAPDSAKLRLLRGRCHFDLRQDTAAEKDYLRAIELDPEYVSAWSQLGLLYHATKKYDDAIDCFDRVLRQSPGGVWALLKRSLAYREIGNDESADADFQAAMAAECNDHFELIARAKAREKQDPEAALEDFRKASQLNPGRPGILREIAFLLAHPLGRHEEAISVFDQVLDMQPRNEIALVDRALSHVRLGHIKEALRDTQSAMVLPNAGRSYYQAACVHALIGKEPNKRRAVELLAKAIQAGYQPKKLLTDPDLESIREMSGFRAISRTYTLSGMGRSVREKPMAVDYRPLSQVFTQQR